MMIKKWLDDRADLAVKVPCLAPPWPLRLAAAATAVALGAYSPAEVQALGLGRITVLSALGEPLRAEIDIPQISPEEAASLKAGIPAPAAFRAAGVEYNAALANAQITLQQRPDGRAFLRLTSDKVVSEPFVDLILETSWSSGRVVRDYTLLFDPPGVRQSAPASPVAPQVPRTAAPSAPVPPAPLPAPVTPRVVPTPAATAPARTERVAPAQSTATPKAAPSDGKQVKVQAGDTAGKIANIHKPSEISLDQMLVALLRANPDAFIGGNINRIKAGALLDLPSAEQVGSLTAEEARKTLSVQSANFNEFRRKLANAAPVTQTAAADRQASGSLQTRVEEKKPTATSPDKLTLSKGAVKEKAPESRIAESRQARETAERAAELSKNIEDLSRLQEKSGAPTTASASGVRTPALPLGATASAVKSLPAPVSPASAMATPAVKASSTPAPIGGAVTSSATTSPAVVASAAAVPAAAASSAQIAASAAPATTASAPAQAASAPADPAQVSDQPAPAASKPVLAATVKPAPAEPSFIDELLDNPIIPIAAGGLIALLAGFGFYRIRQQKKATQVDSSFLESRLQPDSFFGSSGGQRVDTADAAPTGSSLVYSPSQLDAAGDVDPVAEADVYLAYGRDLQAEEILKEALKMNPTRLGIHGKLLEIYAKRRDARAFEQVAIEAHKLTGGDGSEWDRFCELGRELDSENALYQPGGRLGEKPASQAAAEPVDRAFGNSTLPASPHPEFVPSMPVDLDLGDLDISPPGAPAFDAMQTVATAIPGKDDDTGMDWDVIGTSSPVVNLAEVEPLIDISAPAAADQPSISTPEQPASSTALAVDDGGMIEFDLGSLSLDLDQSLPKTQAEAETPQGGSSDQDPMATKLSLAQEFHAIGDSDGARALVEEVVAGATGPLKAKAQRFLADLG